MLAQGVNRDTRGGYPWLTPPWETSLKSYPLSLKKGSGRISHVTFKQLCCTRGWLQPLGGEWKVAAEYYVIFLLSILIFCLYSHFQVASILLSTRKYFKINILNPSPRFCCCIKRLEHFALPSGCKLSTR